MNNKKKTIVISPRVLAYNRCLQHKKEDGTYCAISTTDPGCELPPFDTAKLQSYCNGLLLIKFGDVDTNDDPLYPAITDKQAQAIAAFVMANEDCGTFYINCFAGICRSSAVGAAISLALNGSDSQIWSDKRYRPNAYVYRKLLKAFGLDHGYEEI
jgi:predicted protein tyrosine phosphatase